MKKMRKLLSMMLAVAMLLTSVAALGEGTIPMYYVELSDLDMSVDGESLIDLSPLKLKLGAGVSETGSEVALTADLIAGQQKALSAVIGVAEGKGVASIDGMSKPLTLDVMQILNEDNLMAVYNMIMSQLTEEEQAALEQIIAALQAFASEENINELMNAYDVYMDAVMNILAADIQTQQVNNVFYAGDGEEIPAIMETVVLDEAKCGQILDEAIKFYDSNAALLDLLNAILALDGMEPIESYGELMTEDVRAEAIDEMMLGGDLVIDVYSDNNGELVDIAARIVTDAADEDAEVLGTIDIGIGVTETINFLMQIADDEGDGIFASMDMVPSEEFAGEMETSLYLEATDGGESETLMIVWVGPDPDYGTLGTVTLMPDSEDESFGIAWGAMEGQYIFSMYDAYTTVEFGCLAAEENATDIYLLVDDSGSEMMVSATVTTYTGEMDAQKMIDLAKAKGIDVLSASEKDLEQLGAELETVMMSAMMGVMSNVPDLMEMMMEE